MAYKPSYVSIDVLPLVMALLLTSFYVFGAGERFVFKIP